MDKNETRIKKLETAIRAWANDLPNRRKPYHDLVDIAKNLPSK